MRSCSPAKFLELWPSSLNSIFFPVPPPAIPDECKKLLVDYGLPRKLTIYCYNDLALTFTGSATPLSTIWERDLKRGLYLGSLPPDWTRFWHLADQEYTQGGGWICIEEGSGKLFVIDLDQTDPIYLLNSSVQNFYTTLAYFLEWTEKTDGSLKEIARLNDEIRKQDYIAVEELEPFWINFIEATLDCPIELRIELVQNRQISQKQISAVTALSAPERYAHFIKQVVNQQEVWGLFRETWARGTANNHVQTIIPFWPAKEYAELCIGKTWEGYRARPIDLNEFMENILPSLKEENIQPCIFFLESDNGEILAVNQLLDDLNEELELY